jgi:signal transduction histidine kinase
MQKVSPAGALLTIAVASIAFALAMVVWVVDGPWLGLSLRPDPGADRLVIEAASGPSAGVPAGATLLAIDGFRLAAVDRVEEPDFLETYEAMEAFFARQDALAARVRRPSVTLELITEGGGRESRSIAPAATRPMASLPASFWFQLAVSVASFTIGAWIFVLRPREAGARLLAASGLMLLLSASAAAIYSTRELAIDGATFHALSFSNHVGALFFGCAIAGLFAVHPRPLLRTRWLACLPAVFGPWVVLDALHAFPSPALGMYLPVVLETGLIGLFIALQWRRSGGDPHARIVLRWLGTLALVSAGLFVATQALPILFTGAALVEQGWTFGYFLIVFAGLALGLRRHRLFELDRWAFRILAWALAGLVFIALDALFVLLLHLGRPASSALALSLCGFAYLPVRNLVWGRIMVRDRLPAVEDSFRTLLDVAFAVTDEDRALRWEAVLRGAFDPLEVERRRDEVEQARIERDGLALVVPAVASSPALALALPWGGRGLFGARHVVFAETMVTWMRAADASRSAYDRGALEERARIARDLHDDLGARLLSGLHRSSLDETRDAVRAAIVDLRNVVKTLHGGRVLASTMLADLRHEVSERLFAVGVALEWALDEEAQWTWDQRVGRHLVSIVREAISNVIRHAGASRVWVTIEVAGGTVTTAIRDDGVGFDVSARVEGHGLTHVQQRAIAAGGEARYERDGGFTRVVVRLPIVDDGAKEER